MLEKRADSAGGWGGEGLVLNKVARKSFTQQVTLEQRPEALRKKDMENLGGRHFKQMCSNRPGGEKEP